MTSASSGGLCPPSGNSNFPLTVITVVTEESTVQYMDCIPVSVRVCVCIDVHMSWKVEKTTYPVVELQQPVAPILGLWYYVTMWVFPNMRFVLEKLYESSTVVFNLFCNPRGLLWSYGFCHSVSHAEFWIQYQSFPQLVIFIDLWSVLIDD